MLSSLRVARTFAGFAPKLKIPFVGSLIIMMLTCSRVVSSSVRAISIASSTVSVQFQYNFAIGNSSVEDSCMS